MTTKSKRPKYLSMDDARLDHGLEPAGQYTRFCDWLTGRTDIEPQDFEGGAFSEDMMVARKVDDPRVVFCMRVAGQWCVVSGFPAHSPWWSEQHQAGNLTATKLSHGAEADRERRRQAHQAAQEAAEAERQRQKEKLEERKAAWERQRLEHEHHVAQHG